MSSSLVSFVRMPGASWQGFGRGREVVQQGIFFKSSSSGSQCGGFGPVPGSPPAPGYLFPNGTAEWYTLFAGSMLSLLFW